MLSCLLSRLIFLGFFSGVDLYTRAGEMIFKRPVFMYPFNKDRRHAITSYIINLSIVIGSFRVFLVGGYGGSCKCTRTLRGDSGSFCVMIAQLAVAAFILALVALKSNSVEFFVKGLVTQY